jgi:Tc toxin complex TcA C-terminal TcB-binding domain
MKRRISHSDISKAFSSDPTALLTRLGELNVAAQPASRITTGDAGIAKPAAPLSTAPLSIAGQVIEQKSGLPLAGVTVKWTLSPGQTRARKPRPNEIGLAVTDRQGNFRIEAGANPEAKAALCGIAGETPNGVTYLSLVDRNDRIIGHPTKVPSDTRQIILHPPATEQKPSKKEWKALTNYLTTNRMMLVRDVAEQLARPFTDSPVRDWAVAHRSSALRDLLEAVARQQEKVAGQLDLLEENAFIETASLEEGNVRRAVTHLADEKKLGKFLPSPDKIFPWLRDSDRSLYRDYLRGVWVAAAQKMYQDLTGIAKPPDSLLEQQLDERFQQDFHTTDDTAVPAATLLIPLIVSILTRDDARGGFGFKVADIPAKGTQTDDEYLQVLIGASKVSAQELRNRFRVSFDRAPGETKSPLQLNVEALLGLLADTYQSPEEPFNTMPAVFDNGKPLIFGPYIGRAPFFLEYEEWLERQRAFYPENIYDIRKNIPVFDPDYRNTMEAVKVSSGPPQFPGEGYFDDYAGERSKSGEWIERMFPVVDKIRDALGKMDGQRYSEAKDELKAVSDELWNMALPKNYDSKWVKDKFWWWWSWGAWNNTTVTGRSYPDTYISLKDRAKIHVTNPDELAGFEKFYDPPSYPKWTGHLSDWSPSDNETAEKAIAKARSLYLYNVFYLHDVLIPYLQSQIDFAVGNFSQAIYALSLLTGYRAGIAETTTVPGYDTNAQPLGSSTPLLYQQTTLAYTTLVGFEDNITYTDLQPIFNEGWNSLSSSYGRLFIAPFELRFFKLAQAEVMLAWADQLYRNDDPSSIRRARELYKGVIFLHGEDPEITPHFDRPGQFHLHLPGGDPLFWKYTDNPARVSQLTRARLALYQIDHGLNIYGYRDDMVPVLRYKPLKQAADLLATSAKSAQTDFLNYMTRYEQALIELWQTQSLVKKAQAASGIASEHVAIAQVGVDKAKEQVAAVQAQIAAKQKEIADKNSLFEQFSDYLSGAKDSLTGLVSLAKKVMSEGDGSSAATSLTGEQMLNIVSKGVSGGGSTVQDAGMEFMIGFGVFAYASYTSMESMAAADAKRDGELKALQTTALDAANAQVRLKQRDVAIAQYESQIAAADLEFANTLFRFQQDRFLSADFWNKLTLFANRLMRRYVELGARAAWMAERALAFEQNRSINVIKLNYLPIALRGVTGADRLLADLAELEANRIQGTRFTTPVKHTISLAREFPIAFGQLKKTGHCRFHTREADLRGAYPGTFAYRIRAITVAVHDGEGATPRGVLRNGGVSMVSAEDLTNKVLVRYPDALALSEFRLHDDLFVYGLPGETLLQFEGSGFETDFELEFPIESNPRGLRSMADVLITFDTNAYYSDAVAAKEAAQPLADTPRSIMLAASNLDPKGLDTLKAAAGAARITFDPTKLALPLQETKREVANLAIICVGKTTKKYDATLTASKSAKTAAFEIEDGLAMSNAGALQGTAAALPLNALVGLNMNQPFVLEIDRSGVEAELKQLFDVVLYVDYTASF